MSFARAIAVALLVLAVAQFAHADETDYYDVLQLAEREDASEKDIKANWRRLSREHHPDLKGESSRDMYKTIQRAYEVLSDRRKRKVYDMKGDDGVKQLEKAGGQQQQMPDDPLMRMFFGGGGGGEGAQRGANLQLVILCTLEDVYSGASHTVRLSKQRLCKACRGTGAATKDDFQTCKSCNGQGVTLQRIQLAPGFVQQVQQACQRCGGKGKVIKKKCPVCKGNKVSRIEHTLHVDVEQGTPENHNIVFDMEGDQSPELIPGDVIFTVQTKPHPVFIRNGNDLEATVKLSLGQALLGFSKTLKHLDGHEVELEEDGPTNYGTKRKIAGEGMPKHHVPSEKGHLLVTYDVELPTALTQQQKDVIAKVFPS
jgi:DnaJ-related protein SCJ1